MAGDGQQWGVRPLFPIMLPRVGTAPTADASSGLLAPGTAPSTTSSSSSLSLDLSWLRMSSCPVPSAAAADDDDGGAPNLVSALPPLGVPAPLFASGATAPRSQSQSRPPDDVTPQLQTRPGQLRFQPDDAADIVVGGHQQRQGVYIKKEPVDDDHSTVSVTESNSERATAASASVPESSSTTTTTTTTTTSETSLNQTTITVKKEKQSNGSGSEAESEKGVENGEEGKKHKNKKKKKHVSSKHEKKLKKKLEGHHRNKKAKPGSVLPLMPLTGLTRTPASGTWADFDHPAGQWYFQGSGDKNNILFGSLYRLDVPRFTAPRVRPCVGLPERYVLRSGMSNIVDRCDNKTVVSIPRYCKPQYAIAQVRTDIKRITADQVRKKKRTVAMTSGGDFIPLSLSAYEKEKRDEAIQAELGETFEESLFRRTRELNEATQKPTQTEQTWLDYIKLQDEFAKLGDRHAEGALLEKKIAIYQRALELHPTSEELVLGYLSVIKRSWETSKVLALWEKILAHQGTDLAPRMTGRLWREYIRFCLAGFSTFNIVLARTTYTRAISILSRMKAGVMKDPDADVSISDIDEFLISLIYQMCIVELQAGYTERAIGIFQAVVEFNCFGPNLPRRADFIGFWESEAPRVGDLGAKGWGEWLQQRQDDQARQSEAKRHLEEEEHRLRLQREEHRKTAGGDANGSEWNEELDHENPTESFFRRLQKQIMEDPVLRESYSPSSPTSDHEEEEVDVEVAPERPHDTVTAAPQNNTQPQEEVNMQATEVENHKSTSESDAPKTLQNNAQQEIQPPADEVEWRLKLKHWVTEEDEKDKNQWQPIRPLSVSSSGDLVEISDPDTVVMSEDIQDFLFVISGPAEKLTLAHRFLHFLGIPVPSSWPTCSQHFHDTVSSIEDVTQSPVFSVLVQESSRILALEKDIKRNFQASSVSWLWASEWCAPFCGQSVLDTYANRNRNSPTQQPQLPRGLLDFARRAADLCVSIFQGESSISMGRLLLELRHSDATTCRNLAKRLLSTNRNDIQLWNCYAQMELYLGHPNESSRTYEAALSLAAAQARGSKKTIAGDIRLLFRAYTQVCMQNEPQGSLLPLHIIASAADLSTPYVQVKKGATVSISPTTLLRARRFYAEQISRIQPATVNYDQVELVLCYALFQYLSMGVDAALVVYDAVLKMMFSPATYLHECIAEHRARLLYWHSLTSFTSPTQLRASCADSLQHYPSNTFFSTLYACAETRAHMAFRMRAFFDDLLAHHMTHHNALLWMFAIRMEEVVLHSPVRVRALCERALMNADAQAVPGLWLFLLKYLTQQGDNAKSSKSSYFRGVRHVPWSKAMWLVALKDDKLFDMMNPTELRQIVGLLEEKGVRLHSFPPTKTTHEDSDSEEDSDDS
ncbi:NRDE2 protein [Pelomyxa schiedti]|nr:NRDE2 protein [Pelomyxa schiedti]